MSLKYKLRNDNELEFSSSAGNSCTLSVQQFENALQKTHEMIDKISSFEIDISEILGLRNLSAFVGELFVRCFEKESQGLFLKNPHQDGYPDLLLMDDTGKKVIEEIKEQNGMKNKAPFSPFENGRIEVKATCGEVPKPEDCAKKGLEKPGIGDERIGLLCGYNWKAHHRETNNLVGLLWDFIDQKPRIVAIFFCSSIEEEDWGKVVKPRKNGGRTTSVSIMKKHGVIKMYHNWVLVLDDPRYITYLNKYNKGELLK